MSSSEYEEDSSESEEVDVPTNSPAPDYFDFKRGTDNDLFDAFDGSHSTIVYGSSGQGKTYMMRQYINRFLSRRDTTVIIFKATIEEEDRDLYDFSRKHPDKLHFADMVDLNLQMLSDDKSKEEIHSAMVQGLIRKIRFILKHKSKSKVSFFRGKNKTPNREKFVIVLDDILALEHKNRTELNKTIKELSVQGRHDNLQLYILLQHYKSVEKISRSNADVFCTLCPPNDEYVQALWQEYFRMSSFKEFKSFLRTVPRYSKLAKKQQTGEIWLISPSRN